MTYGWMLLVVAIAGGAVFSVVQGQNIENVTGFTSNDVRVDDFGVALGGLQMSVGAYGANSVTMRAIGLNDSELSLQIPLNQDISTGETEIFNLPHFKTGEGTNQIEIELLYDSADLENITTSGTIVGGIEIDDDLVGYWPIKPAHVNETHVLGLAQYQLDGRISGDPEFISDEEKEEVMYFDGENDYLEISHHEALNAGQFTVSLWVKNMGDGEGDYPKIVDKGGNSQWQIHSNPSGERFVFNLGTVNGLCQVSEDEVFNRGEWTHAAITYNGDRQRLFANGVLVGENMCSEDTETTSDKLTIGARDGGVGSYNGSIRGIQVHSRALSGREIQNMYGNSGQIW